MGVGGAEVRGAAILCILSKEHPLVLRVGLGLRSWVFPSGGLQPIVGCSVSTVFSQQQASSKQRQTGKKYFWGHCGSKRASK